jgi:hypothetical protein
MAEAIIIHRLKMKYQLNREAIKSGFIVFVSVKIFINGII